MGVMGSGGAVELPISPYEQVLAQTVDEAELFVWWRETRGDPSNRWARLLPEDLALRLYDAGIRSLARLRRGWCLVSDGQRLQGEDQIDREALNTVKALIGEQDGFDPPLWYRLVQSALQWEPWPEGFRRQLSGRYGFQP